MKRKVNWDFLDRYIAGEETRNVRSVATAFQIAGLAPSNFGRTNLYAFLRRIGMLKADNTPTRRAVELGLAVTEEIDLKRFGYTLPWGERHRRGRLTRRGIRHVADLLTPKSEPVPTAEAGKTDYKPLF